MFSWKGIRKGRSLTIIIIGFQVVALERPELVAQEFATSMELLGGLRKVRKICAVIECSLLALEVHEVFLLTRLSLICL